MGVGDCQKVREGLRRIGSTLHWEKIDNLNEKFRLTIARCAHRFDELLQSWQEPIVADAQKRPAGNIAHARRFDDQRRGSSVSKTAIPIEIVLRNKTVFGRAPGHHRRHPDPTCECYSPNAYRLKQA